MDSTHVAIAVGANLGDRRKTIDEAIARVHASDGVRPLGCADLIETAPVGPVDQPAYLNGAITIETTLSPTDLLDRLLDIERSLGRVRADDERWGPRTIDLDILLYGDRVIETEPLTVPHARMHEREFVLAPLAEIAPEWVHPALNATIADLLGAVREGSSA